MKNTDIRSLISQSVASYKNNLALSFVDGEKITYGDLYTRIIERANILKNLGIEKGDKVAILSTYNPYWGISYLAVVFIGATTVPILNDFSASEIQNILEHSEAKAIVTTNDLKYKLTNTVNCIQYVLNVEDFSLDAALSTSSRPKVDKFIDKTPDDLAKQFGELTGDELASIIYTSGTTGLSKGVMLSHKNLISNIIATSHIQSITEIDRLLSILPLSHSYECTLGFLMPLANGASVYYLAGAPVASILLPALQTVQPTMMLSVPLIIEKIYKMRIKPKFSKGTAKSLYSLAPTRKLLNFIAGKKLMHTFGGKLKFFGIGGALLDAETEKFLREANFPYAIGYGLTETAPLLAGSSPQKTRYRSTGFALPGQDLKLIDVNLETGEGEIVAKGNNVMKGYYKNDDLTQKCFTEDGWFRTGDLGYIDRSNHLFIKGRLKNMILTANGENIYPEQIEAILTRHQYVTEAIVYEMKGKLVAKVHLNYQEVEEKFNKLKESAKVLQSDMQQYIRNILDDIKAYVNSEVSKFAKLALIIEHPVPFEKTPTQKIKKYLYI